MLPPDCFAQLKAAVKALKREVLALYYASQDPDVGCLPKCLIALALAYVLSPLDLVPDFIPILGLLDDLLIVPWLIWLALKFIPPVVMDAARQRAEEEPLKLSKHLGAAAVFLLIWLACFEAGAATLVEHWPLAHAHKAWTYGSVTALYVGFAVAAVVSEDEEAAHALCARCASCCGSCWSSCWSWQPAALGEALLPKATANEGV